jgi:hypothetical protein
VWVFWHGWHRWPVERVSEHTAVEEPSGTEGLVLGGGGDLVLDREMVQQGLDVCAAHRLGRACVVEEHVPCDPGDRRVLRMPRLVLASDGIASVVEPLLGTRFHGLSRPEIMG